jgi:coproporphyrinogen III oxidase
MTVTDTRTIVHDLMRDGQHRLCAAFEKIDNHGHFVAENWERPGGGGGTARVMTEGAVFERAGVNVSAVHGAEVPPSIWQHRPSTRGQPYFATGISMVLHPRNPYVPAFHANFRYFEAGEDWWFGGGMDLTPNYGFVEDAHHFHVTLRDYCDRHPIASYAEMKAACDNYFFLKHRNEMRGIGGIFFDDLHPTSEDGFERAFAFVRDGITTILDAYLPIVRRRMNTPYGERERMWQLYRRGRYVEFNLIYDRGTLFGLQTGGNIEAILMSLPPLARWQFKYQPEPGSPEAAMAEFLKPRDWASETSS